MDSKDYFKQFEAERAAHAVKPWYRRVPIDVGEYIWYRVIRRIRDVPSELRWWWQELTRGYSDCDVWGLSHYIIEKIRPPLKHLISYQKESGHGYPGSLNSSEEWLEILKKIEYSFDEIYKDDFTMEKSTWETLPTVEEREAYNKKIQEGFELFGKFLLNLWD